MNALPVEPTLFDPLIEYATLMTGPKFDFKKPLKEASPIPTFCQNFFVQFFDHELGVEITSIGDEAKKKAVAARRDLRGNVALPIVTSFEKLCEIYPDVLGMTYGRPTTSLRDFYAGYLTSLLRRTEKWAHAKNYGPLVDKSAAAQAAIAAALKKFPKR